jgi:hypothetical protein
MRKENIYAVEIKHDAVKHQFARNLSNLKNAQLMDTHNI